MSKTITNNLSAKAFFLIVSMTCAFAFSACASDPQSRSMGRTVDDAWISSKVKSTLLADTMVNGTAVEVETYRGKVMLSGFMDTEDQIQRAVKLTKDIEGVTQVVNKMVVKSDTMGKSGTMDQSRTSGSGTFEEPATTPSQSRIQ